MWRNLLFCALLSSGFSASAAEVVAWGDDSLGQTTPPSGLSDVSSIAAAGYHTIALQGNGDVVAWGDDRDGQCTLPVGLHGVTAISTGPFFAAAVKSDQTVAVWGNDGGAAIIPPRGLRGVISVAVGGAFVLALKSDGSVVAWGIGTDGNITVPGGLAHVVAVAAGSYHSVALREDGTVVAWGDNSYGQTRVPRGLRNVTAVAACGNVTLALKHDGTVVAWGDSSYGQTLVPASLSDVVSIAAGAGHALALRSDGTVVAWGTDFSGETEVPSGLSGVTAIAGGLGHTVALAPSALKGSAQLRSPEGNPLEVSVVFNQPVSLIPAQVQVVNGTCDSVTGLSPSRFLIRITPAAAGTVSVSIPAGQVTGMTTGMSNADAVGLSFTVSGSPPTITGYLQSTVQVGQPFIYDILAADAGLFTATGLPPGLAVDAANGEIRGVPSVSGTFAVTLGATNGWGTGNATLDITVAADVILTVAGGGLPTDPHEATLPGIAGVCAGPDGTLYFTSGNRVLSLADDGVMRIVAGRGDYASNGDGGPAGLASLKEPAGLAIDGAGDLLVAERGAVRRISMSTGIISTIVGTGALGFSGDGGPAVDAQVSLVTAIAVDGDDLYLCDKGNQRIRRVVGATGDIETVAGNGQVAFDGGTGALAIDTPLGSPHGIAVDGDHNILFTEEYGWRLRRVDGASGIIETIPCDLYSPQGIAVDAAGNIYVADTQHHDVQRLDSETLLSTVVAGTKWMSGYSGDGGLAVNAKLAAPSSIVLDAAGNLYVGDFENWRIRRVDALSQAISTIAGSGRWSPSGGDGQLAVAGQLYYPNGCAVDSAGNLYVADTYNYRVRRVDGATGVMSTVAGGSQSGYSGDGGPATTAGLAAPRSVAVAGASDLLIVDGARIRRVDALSGSITTVAGTGTAGYGGDGGPAVEALLQPAQVLADRDGNLIIADQLNHRVRRIDAVTERITTIVGTGAQGYNGDGISAVTAQLNHPAGVALDADGNLFIVETGGSRIRRVDSVTGIITTVAGNGAHVPSGDGGPAILAGLQSPVGIAVDGLGNLFVAEAEGNAIRRIDGISGLISTLAGDGTAGFAGDGGLVGDSVLRYPVALACDARNWLYISDSGNLRLRCVRSAGSNQSISFTDPGPHAYGDAPFALQATADSGLPVTFSVSSGPAVLTGSLVQVTGAGNVVLHAYQVGDDQYLPAAVAQVVVSVVPAPLTVVAAPQTRSYGSANPAFTYAAAGFVGGDTTTSLSGSLASPATVTSPAGSYPITRGTLSSANYRITFTGADLTVVPASLTIKANDAQRAYGSGDPAFGYWVVGLRNGEAIGAVSLTTAATVASLPGSYPIVAAGAVFTVGSSADYVIAYESGSLIVTQTPLIISADDKIRSEREDNPPLTFSCSGWMNGEDDSVLTAPPVLSTSATQESPAGAYPITISGAASPAYEIIYVAGTLTVAGEESDSDSKCGQGSLAIILLSVLAVFASWFAFARVGRNR